MRIKSENNVQRHCGWAVRLRSLPNGAAVSERIRRHPQSPAKRHCHSEQSEESVANFRGLPRSSYLTARNDAVRINPPIMRLFLTILFILISLIGYCQVDLFFPLESEFDWVNVEKQNPELRKRFAECKPDGLEYFYIIYEDNEDIWFSILAFDEDFHVIDFNGDGLDDIIFHGYTCREAKEIIIFINTGDSFVNIFDDYQEIYKMEFQNGKVRKLYIQHDGCCCDHVGTNKIYNVDHTSELPKINLISKIQYINDIFHPLFYNEDTAVYPSKYFDKPIKFKVLKDNTIIRFSPIIDDTTEFGYCGNYQNGNSLGKIKLGSIGYALAEQVDATGQIWWYVAFSPNVKIHETIYHDYKAYYNKDSYKLGWISSRFVKIIEE